MTSTRDKFKTKVGKDKLIQALRSKYVIEQHGGIASVYMGDKVAPDGWLFIKKHPNMPGTHDGPAFACLSSGHIFPTIAVSAKIYGSLEMLAVLKQELDFCASIQKSCMKTRDVMLSRHLMTKSTVEKALNDPSKYGFNNVRSICAFKKQLEHANQSIEKINELWDMFEDIVAVGWIGGFEAPFEEGE
jgi:hypothetical protein